ncbi:MAG: hypothetical protein SOX17_07945, partial [Prevotella sp.]|nr:hypothetical protein [Prevotella sp.]
EKTIKTAILIKTVPPRVAIRKAKTAPSVLMTVISKLGAVFRNGVVVAAVGAALRGWLPARAMP